MKKSTKIITTAVALALVVAAMVVGIYAATSATSTITAAVNWNAVSGITFTLDGTSKAYGTATDSSPTTKNLTQQVVTAATSNTASAALAGTLSTSFVDESSDGVNNPGKIEFIYTLKNTGTTGITVRLSKAPTVGNEAISGGTHTPKVEMSGSNGSTAVTAANLIASTPVITVAGGATLTVTITLSLAAGGTNSNINADTSVSSFDAGVTFVLGKAA